MVEQGLYKYQSHEWHNIANDVKYKISCEICLHVIFLGGVYDTCYLTCFLKKKFFHSTYCVFTWIYFVDVFLYLSLKIRSNIRWLFPFVNKPSILASLWIHHFEMLNMGLCVNLFLKQCCTCYVKCDIDVFTQFKLHKWNVWKPPVPLCTVCP